MRSCWASTRFWSMLILTSFTAPLAAFTTFSMAGCSCLQGPHHGAQKSTITGTVREASSTSLANWVWSLSFMRSAGAACCAAPFSMVSMGPRAGEFSRRPQCGPPFRWTHWGRGRAVLAVFDFGDDAVDVIRRENRGRAGAVGAGEGSRLGHLGVVDIVCRQWAFPAVQPFDAQIAGRIGA